MKSAQDIESYLLRLGLPFDQLSPEMWNIKAEHENLVVSIGGPLLVFRVKVMDLPRAGREALYEALLTLNATEMVHGAFGIEGHSIVIVHALELENLDYNEFAAVIDDITLAVSKHYPALSKHRDAA